MNEIGKRLGFALVFTGVVVALNTYVVLNGSAETFYEGITEFLASTDKGAETELPPDLLQLEDDCGQLAQVPDDTVGARSVSHTNCAEGTAIGI